MAPQAERGHELIEHTADVGLRIWAPTLNELFAEAALGLVDVMGRATGPAVSTHRVACGGPSGAELDYEGRLVDWLSEVLFLFDARGIVPIDARVELSHDEARLEATLDATDMEHFGQHGPAVKAVTYHALELRETDAGYEARVYLDV